MKFKIGDKVVIGNCDGPGGFYGRIVRIDRRTHSVKWFYSIEESNFVQVRPNPVELQFSTSTFRFPYDKGLNKVKQLKSWSMHG